MPASHPAPTPRCGAFGHRLVKLPAGISAQQAAAMMLQGMTARYLLKGAGTSVRHGAADPRRRRRRGADRVPVGSASGATVIGTTGSPEKANWPGRMAAHPLVYTQEDFASRVKEITAARG